MSDNDGKDFESLVGHIERSTRPLEAIVTVDDTIQTKYGPRQFDVTVRFRVGGVERVILIEAKDWKRKPKAETVEAFIQKCRHVEHSQGIMVSREGFSQPSIAQARDYGVTLKRIATTDGIDWAREIKLPFHVEEHRIVGLRVYISGLNGAPLPARITIPDEFKARINERVDAILKARHSEEVYRIQAFREQDGVFAITNGSSQIDLELFYKFTVSRSVYSGQRPAVSVLGYENLNKDKLELVRFGHRLDGTALSEGSYGDELENLGDVDLE